MRDIAGSRNDLFNPSHLITNDLGFCGFKIHSAAHTTLLEQGLVHLMQMQQMRHHRLALFSFRPPCIAQNGSDFGIGKTGLAEHDRRVKLVGVNLSLGVDQHVADHAQPFNIRVERAQAIGQLFRQHGNHAARKIHAGGTVVGVNVNRTAGFNVMADICNSD